MSTYVEIFSELLLELLIGRHSDVERDKFIHEGFVFEPHEVLLGRLPLAKSRAGRRCS